MTWDLRQQLALDGLATHNHVECGLHTQDPRQALRATRTGNQPQFDFWQGDAAARCGDTVVAAEGQLQATAHANRVNGCDHRLGRIFNGKNHAQQIWLSQRLWAAKLLDIGTPRKSLASTRDHDGFDSRVKTGLLQVISDAEPGRMAKTIDRRIAQGDDSHAAVNFIKGGHGSGFLG